MRKKLEKLIEFQAVEAEGDLLAAFINNAPEKINLLDHKLDEAQKAFDDEKGIFEDLKKKYRDFEADIQTNVSSMKKSQEKLSSVKTNKEYQAMLKEIDELKKGNVKIEDEMILILEQVESAESEQSQKNETLKRLKAEISAEKAVVSKDAGEKEQQLSSINKKLSGLAQHIDAELIATYERVKCMVTGAAVVPVSESVCKGCHLNIPPQMYNELQRGENLKICPHCARILYWDPMTDA
jgi:uncharacterized protein